MKTGWNTICWVGLHVSLALRNKHYHIKIMINFVNP